MTSRLNHFVFSGLLATHAVQELRLNGILRSPAATPDERSEHDLFAPVAEVIRNASREMQRSYRVLFAFENSAREFISTCFAEVDGDDWFERRATSDMKRKVEQRKA